MLELKKRFTIAIVTHNLQQAQRVADYTGFLYVDTTGVGAPDTWSNSETHISSLKTRKTSIRKDYIRGEFS